MSGSPNKKPFKKIFYYAFCLLISLHMHVAVFFALKWFHKLDKNVLKPKSSTQVSIRFMPVQNFQQESLSKNIQKIQSHKLESIQNSSKILNLYKNDKNIKFKNFNKENVKNIHKNKEIKSGTMNTKIENANILLAKPFNAFYLPKILLNKNYFPRKYSVTLVINSIDKKIVNYQMTQFDSLENKLEYLDKKVHKAFYDQLSNLPMSTFCAWLSAWNPELLAKIQSSSELYQSDTVSVVLDIHEPNW